ncbi:MAG: hypothetical protein C0421_05680 [Hyphomonas sp.]|uniref:gene transfer agent family protein n=1 Tax=Hyphomonas sp. TaxID=87 RepID=UPI0025C26B9C|nr:gene transfer agent family protein [Hyphomonas sp.]MBA4338317.1 hypothetical protein [Hyphomonas sp.]
MSRVVHYLGSRPYPFCLDAPGVSEIETLSGFGLWALEARLLSGTCTTSEVQNLFRLGLRGGGASEQDALLQTSVHVVIGRMDKARAIALAVVSDALRGITLAEAEADKPGDPPGKPAGADAPPSEVSTTDDSTGQPSTGRLRSRGSRRPPSGASK